jgi:hypothetical protein
MNRAIGLLSGGSGAESYQAGTVPGCDTAPVLIRDATAADWPAIWPFLHAIVSAGDTFAYDPAMGHDEARAMWLVGPPGRTVVAVDGDAVAGTANMYPNHGGPGIPHRQRELHGPRRPPRPRDRPGVGRGDDRLGAA